MRRGLHDVRLDLENVLQRLVARLARRRRELRPAQELLGVGERDRARAAARERSQVVGADDHAVRGEAARDRRRGERARQPAVRQVLIGLRCGVPDLDRAEVRQVRIRITDALKHGQSPVLPQRQERREGRMQSRAVGQLHHRIARDRDLRPQRVIVGIGVGDQRVEAVVAALQFDQHQQVAVIGTGVDNRGRGGEGHARGRSAECAERGRGKGRAEEAAAFHRRGSVT